MSSASKLTRGIVHLACTAAILGMWSAALNLLASRAPEATTVTGTVRDPAGQPLPGVTVVALQESGGVPARATTDPEGRYQIDGLARGVYRLDFLLLGFTAVRQNHVQLDENGGAQADAVLSVRPICECLTIDPQRPTVSGQVVDFRGRPLPHARLELRGPNSIVDVERTDDEGRFGFKPPRDRWSLVASDSGFESMTLERSGVPSGPIVFRLRFVGTRTVPQTERFNESCPCYMSLTPGEH